MASGIFAFYSLSEDEARAVFNVLQGHAETTWGSFPLAVYWIPHDGTTRRVTLHWAEKKLLVVAQPGVDWVVRLVERTLPFALVEWTGGEDERAQRAGTVPAGADADGGGSYRGQRKGRHHRGPHARAQAGAHGETAPLIGSD